MAKILAYDDEARQKLIAAQVDLLDRLPALGDPGPGRM